MYRYEFTEKEIFTNRIKTYPEFNLFMYLGNLYVNNDRPLSGTTGGISLYNINNNRTGDLKVYPFVQVRAAKTDFRSRNPNPMLKLFSENHGYIGPYQFLASRDFGHFPQEGTVTSSYSSNVPITRRYTSPIASFTRSYYNIASSSVLTSEVTFPVSVNLTASALQNVAKKYVLHSNHFEFNSSALGRNLLTSNVNFVFIPKVYYGSTIKKGSVILNYFITGSKIASCHDKNENGELIETTGSKSGSVVGIVMYDEGVIMLTGSHTLGVNNSIEYVSGSASTNTWLHYGATMNDTAMAHVGESKNTIASASFGLDFKGTSYVNTMTLLAKAPKGRLNHSNNPTYKKKNSVLTGHITSSTLVYRESISEIKNIVTSSHTSASFEKITYISKVNVYDENENLIGVATLAKPVKKTIDKEFIFKLKLDI